MSQDYAPPRRFEDEARPPKRTGRHPVNIGHLVMGLAFLVFVGVWALIASDTVVIHSIEDLRWLLPLPWIVGGSVGLLAALLRKS
ncbi:hypothetical protein [Nocardioides albus]|uniref:Uncharacterized protein n=1 Tax=Nocardioides albus TaxID=1841 RepID=A0A7W5A0R7_9ACTN|nr:hypothetical protein [Nocardioides albus]MBB3087394.1 hypothetical protein [Nocardioides albus]GGU08677.1 hypothetical protein GCM10007979_03180 [Nocardioides albus]